ncbi:MAG: 4Fe-4S binding protein [Candidatus Omnitrophica bacterium]|nr:4Fe-4S binding protein [Candidatus Omnitrophota bacterium]
MSEERSVHQAALPQKMSAALATVVILTLGMLSAFTTREAPLLVAKALWICAIGFMAYRVFLTGIIGRWRSVFFIILAWSFVVHFKAQLIGLTGSAFITPEIQEVPYCHIAMSSSFLNYLYQQYLALMSGSWLKWSPLTWGALWLLVTLALGQAWCSWACMYGGLDSGFSKILRKPLVKWRGLPKGLRDLPAGILVAALLISLVTLKPVFCLWMCPLKLGTGFLEPDTLKNMLQFLSFFFIGLFFLVLLPLLTKKRAFCGLICPFGAWQSFFGRINPYRVKIDPDKCTLCEKCVSACPTFAIDKDRPIEERVLPYCNRCGECMDVCPALAIDYHLVGEKKLGIPNTWPRRLFLLSSWMVAGAVSLLFVPEALLRLWRCLPL